MSRGKQAFRQKDVTKAIKAVKASGIEIGRIEIAPNGSIIILPGKPVESPPISPNANEWDTVL